MGFLAPFMLIGGAAAGIPLALHFLYRAHYRQVPWGAMKFLRLAIEQTSRRLKFQEIVLLILRILLMLLLAAALARPIACSTVTAGKRGEAVDAVFVIDLSYSMNSREGAKSRLDLVSGDRLVRSARLFAIAAEVLEDGDEAARWLKAPQRALAGAVPLQLAQTDVGTRAVEALLGRMEHGVYT